MNKFNRLESCHINSVLAIILCIFLSAGCKQKIIDTNPIPEYTLEKIIGLPMQVHESSGIIYFDSLFWTFNDGGNESVVFGINALTGEIVKALTIINIEQKDWEDIAQDSVYIYIGDFGNNYGSRENLSVIRFLKSQISDLPEQEIISETISFSYPDQVDFSANYRNTSFDCEALTCIGDSLILFTKDWVNNTSSVYRIPKIPGNYVALKIGTIDSEGLVAGADFNQQTNQLVLTGYSNYIPFIIEIENFIGYNFSSNVFSKISFEDFLGVKSEGITCNDGKVYISTEGSPYQQAIYQVIKK